MSAKSERCCPLARSDKLCVLWSAPDLQMTTESSQAENQSSIRFDREVFACAEEVCPRDRGVDASTR